MNRRTVPGPGIAAVDHYLAAHIAPAAQLPWIPAATPGKASRPLRFLPRDSGFVELLRMEPGTVMPLHRHTGAAYAYNVAGNRLLCGGEHIGPGDYVYEPPGNTDWWKVVGDEALIALVVVMGEVEFLGPGAIVVARTSARTQRDACTAYCRAHGLVLPDICEGD